MVKVTFPTLRASAAQLAPSKSADPEDRAKIDKVAQQIYDAIQVLESKEELTFTEEVRLIEFRRTLELARTLRNSKYTTVTDIARIDLQLRGAEVQAIQLGIINELDDEDPTPSGEGWLWDEGAEILWDDGTEILLED